MSTPSHDRWEELSPYLDQALALSGEARKDWLAGLRNDRPEIAREVEDLLLEHDSLLHEGFLEHSPLPPVAHSGSSGQAVGAYRIVSEIGQGGMGTVWLAERSDGRFRRQAAVKFISLMLAGRAGEERFKREGNILGRLQHPHIAELLDAGVTGDSRAYLVLEYVEGEPIDQYCDAHRLDVRARITLFLDVLAAVAHAHSNLIVHRDLKPSNVMVRRDGQVKLLDFGIAKLLEADDVGSLTVTRDGAAPLTPEYASPEQVRGVTQTIATDVYSLGALLYKLLTGSSPHILRTATREGMVEAICVKEPVAPSRLNPQLPPDLNAIVSRALRKEPAERYASVDAFAADLRAFLEWRPVAARSGNAWYRTRRFLRRYRLAVGAVALVLVSLSAGLYEANRQRVIAERRFQQVRNLAGQFLALDTAIQVLPGATQARHQIVSTSLKYLQALESEVHSDRELQLEMARAYLQVAKVQGVPSVSNLGEFDQAEKTLVKADEFATAVLRAEPHHRAALATAADIAHARMILSVGGPPEEVVRQARRAADYVESLLSLPEPTPDEVTLATAILSNVANAHNGLQRYEASARYARRAVEISKGVPAAQRMRGIALGRLAGSLTYTGELEAALQAATEGRDIVESATYASDLQRSTALADILGKRANILAQEGAFNLGRVDEALQDYRRALELEEQMAAKDPSDSRSRFTYANTGVQMAGLLVTRDPRTALALYDRILARLAETKPSANRSVNEASALAGAAMALVRLHRLPEADRRLNAAFAALHAAHHDWSSRVSVPSTEQETLRVQAAYQEALGAPRLAASLYQDLLAKMQASQATPDSNLHAAFHFSRLYADLERTYRASGEADRAASARASRLDLWRVWQRRLPSNSRVAKELEMASNAS